MPAVLQFENVTKEYRSWLGRRLLALDDFSLAVEQGEIFGFLGPNGAGKTTAIHLAMGFMRPTSGRGQMLGQPFGDAKTRRRVGFLAENVALYHRPAMNLVSFYGALNGLHGEDLERRSEAALAEVQLSSEARRNVGKFSRGMAQRVGLAQALVNLPDLLILDEPTSALDPAARVVVRELLLKMREQGKTIFLSSHLLSEVELVCDRIAVMARGRMLRIGCTSDLLYSSQDLVVAFRGGSSDAAKAFAPDSLASGDYATTLVPRQQLQQTLEGIWGRGGEVLSVSPHKRSLEEMFLEVTREADESHPTEINSADSTSISGSGRTR